MGGTHWLDAGTRAKLFGGAGECGRRAAVGGSSLPLPSGGLDCAEVITYLQKRYCVGCGCLLDLPPVVTKRPAWCSVCYSVGAKGRMLLLMEHSRAQREERRYQTTLASLKARNHAG